MKFKLKFFLIALPIILILFGLFFFPKSDEVTVIDKIQKRSWFIPVIAEDNLTLVVDTDKEYFYIRGEFDTDGIRHIFKTMEPGKKYEIAYFGVRFNPLNIYPFIASAKAAQ
ncbi:MAG: hypothetical protein Q7R84_00385 [bacterium]|nr:hypothetical protein [bacterium]